MTQYIIRPASVITNGGGTNPSAQATVLANLSDNSDATTVANTGTRDISWVFGLSAPTIPATEYVARVGISMRWKGNAAGRYTIGAAIYRATDQNPGAVSALYPNNSAAFTTSQLGYMAVAWTPAEVASLRYLWYDGRSSSSWGQTDHADLFGTIFTITKATATPSARTETQSAYPTIPVAIAATIDWEASTFDWQNLRKVVAEVRIEQGGTGVGTGTLVSTSTYQTTFTATGTQNVSVAMPDALTNGTYKVYSRAIRYRQDGTSAADTTSAWSTAATLTMSAPRPVTPTVTVSAFNASDSVVIQVTPTASTNYAGPFIYIERSDNEGVTWTPVRRAYGIAGTFGTASSFTDYEAARNQAVLYRAKVEATYSSAAVNASLWSTPVSTYLNPATWNLKAPDTPDLNAVGVNVIGRPTEKTSENLGVFRPLGRKYPVVVGGTLTGWDGELTIVCSTSAEWMQLRALVEAQTILRLESTFGWAKYIRIVSEVSAELFGTTTAPKRNVSIGYVEVDVPAIIEGETIPTVVIPSLIDGGTASVTFADFLDGGTATSTYIAAADGGGAA